MRVVELLVAAQEVDVNKACTTGGVTPLCTVAALGHADVVKRLVATLGVDVVNTHRTDGATPLCAAHGCEHADVAQKLHTAGVIEWWKLLIAAGADINKPNNGYGLTPLCSQPHTVQCMWWIG